jgi:hypothetical protein
MGIARMKLLQLMQENAAHEGVQINFGTRIANPALLQGYDLIVGG